MRISDLFTLKEITEFLEKKGYTISKAKVWENVTSYHNQVDTCYSETLIAHKDNKFINSWGEETVFKSEEVYKETLVNNVLRETFEKEIKKKLLEL